VLSCKSRELLLLLLGVYKLKRNADWVCAQRKTGDDELNCVLEIVRESSSDGGNGSSNEWQRETSFPNLLASSVSRPAWKVRAQKNYTSVSSAAAASTRAGNQKFNWENGVCVCVHARESVIAIKHVVLCRLLSLHSHACASRNASAWVGVSECWRPLSSLSSQLQSLQRRESTSS